MVDAKGKGKGKGKEIAGKSSSGKRKSSRPPDGAASGSQKHRRSGVLQFFDHVADVDDDDDEDDDSDSDFLSDDGMDLEDYEKQQKNNQIPFLLKEEEANDSEIEKFVRERYKRGSKYVSHGEEAKGSDEENSSMQFNGGPIMWKRGHERKLVVCLIQKFIDLHSVGKKLEIKSAFCLDHIKGHIYLEADRDGDIVEACKGMFGIFTNTMIHVPSNEIPYLFSVRGASMEVPIGEWVRVKHGTYKGDLAKVIDVDDRRTSAMIKLVPRVDLQAVVNKTDSKKSIKKGTAVPAPHLIRAYELERLQQFVKLKRNKRTGEVFETIGGLTLKDGFLYKKVRLESLNCWDVRPSDIELEQFKDSKKVSMKDHLWLSKLYGERRNNKSKEVNKVDNGKGSSSLVSCEMREWELFDLVFFEKKRFGVIIGIDGDSFQILKGNCERLETTTITVRDIKQQQWEEETTSLDHNSNLISLNDVVRILKGPFKGKQGIVKHIIQGILFIYDNNHIEANGFCCAQTKNCEAIKYSHGPSDESFWPVPPGFEASTSLPAEPEPEPEETPKNPCVHRERPAAAGFRSRSSNGDFYVGQTLRIRVGPLKGYLCRVIDAYRSDITVKLDSQMKVIKVKVDDVTVVVAKGYGSVARDEWTGIPSTSVDLPGVDDANTPGFSWKLTDQRTICSTGGQQTTKTTLDSWGETMAVSQRNDSEQPLDDWNQKRDANHNQNDSWNIPAMQRNETEVMSTDEVDGWGKPASQRNKTDGVTSSDNWGKDVGGWANERDGRQNHSDDKAQNWKEPTNQWDKEQAAACGQQADSSPRGAGVWNIERDARSLSDDKRQSWDKKEVPARGGTCSWGKPAGGWASKGDQSDVKAQTLEKAQTGLDDQAQCWGKPTRGWEDKMGNTSRSRCEGWNKQQDKAGVAAEDQVDFHDSSQAKEEGADWSQGAPSGKPSNAWNKLTGTAGGQADDCWGVQDKEKDASSGQGDGWDKAEIGEGNQGDGWSKASGSQQEDKGTRVKLLGGWDRPKDQWNKGEDAVGKQVGCSEKASCGWGKQTDASGSNADSWHSGCSQSRQDGSGWQKSGGWSESRLVGGSEYEGWNRLTDGNECRSVHQRMERAPGRGRGSGRWNGRGDRVDNWRKPRTDSSDNTSNFCGHQLVGWQKNEKNNRVNQSTHWKRMEDTWDKGKSDNADQAAEDLKTWDSSGSWSQDRSKTENAWDQQTTISTSQTTIEICDTKNSGYACGSVQQSQGWKSVTDARGKQAGGGGGSWGGAETEGGNKLDGWGNTSDSKNTAADASGKDAGNWKMSSGSQTWDEPESAHRNTLNQEAGGWGMSSASESRKNTESRDGNASDVWGKSAENRGASADASREAVIWGISSGTQNCISSASHSWKNADSAGRNALDCLGKAAEAGNFATDAGKEKLHLSSESQSLEKKESVGGNASDASKIDTETGNRAVDTSGKDDGAWGKYSSQSWDKKENAGGDASDGWGKGPQNRNGAVYTKMNEASGWEKSSGFQLQDKTENVKGNASGGWEDVVEVGKDSTDESSKAQGGCGKLSGSHSWGSSSGDLGKAAEGWNSAAGASANEVGGWGKANASSGFQSWENAEIVATNNSDGWGKVEDGWKSTSNPTKSYTGGGWKNSASKSWGKVNNWQQSAETGEDSKAMHEDGSEGWNRPRFGDSGRTGYPGRGRGPPRADGRGILGRGSSDGNGRGGRGRGPSDGNGRGGRGRGSFDRFGSGGRGRGPLDGNGRGGFRGRGPYGGSTRNWNRDDDCGQPGIWSKPVEPESLGGNLRWSGADESSHKSGSWSSWSTASGCSGQTNDDQGRQTESQKQGGNQQRNRTDPGGNESRSWGSASGGSDQAKDGNGGSGW